MNDIDGERRGLHTRAADEMTAWDNVVGHHRGLSHAHQSCIKSTKKLVTEEMQELQRHGIVHGMIVNYNNIVVATKAWNRLFAIADWAAAREKEREPKPEPPKFRETLVQIRKNVEAQKALDAWSPSTLNPGDPGFETDAVAVATADYLSAWRDKNFGKMANFIPRRLMESSINKMAGEIRRWFNDLHLEQFEIVRLNFEAPAVCEVDVVLSLPDGPKAGRMRWIHEDAKGDAATPNVPGEWRLWLWGPYAIFDRASEADPEADS